MNTYRFGLRFKKFRNLVAIIVAVMVFGFYFIYDYFFEGLDWWDPRKFAYIFLVIGIVFVALTILFFNKLGDTMYYRLTANALEVSAWGRSVFYPYTEFREAYYRPWGPFDTVPVEFKMKDGRKMEINQYIHNLEDLTYGLLKKIEPYATFQDGLLSRVGAITTEAAKKKKLR